MSNYRETIQALRQEVQESRTFEQQRQFDALSDEAAEYEKYVSDAIAEGDRDNAKHYLQTLDEINAQREQIAAQFPQEDPYAPTEEERAWAARNPNLMQRLQNPAYVQGMTPTWRRLRDMFGRNIPEDYRKTVFEEPGDTTLPTPDDMLTLSSAKHKLTPRELNKQIAKLHDLQQRGLYRDDQ